MIGPLRGLVMLGLATVSAGVALTPAAAGAHASPATPAAGSLAVIAGRSQTVAPGPATRSPIGAQGVAVDASGNLYIADTLNDVVEKVTPSGTLSIIAGVAGHAGAPTAGPATQSKLGAPSGVAIDASGNLYIADLSNDEIEKVTPSGTLSIVAGTGSAGAPTAGPATQSELDFPSGVAVDSSGNLYIADTDNCRIEKVAPSGTLSVLAGNGNCGPSTPGSATGSELDDPTGVAVNSSGNLYIADTDDNQIDEVTPSGTLSIVAGTGDYGQPTPGSATRSELASPSAVTVDAAGNLYIADLYNNVVEKVTPSGKLSIVAGSGMEGAPTPGPAKSSRLGFPSGVAMSANHRLYIADAYNDRVERVSSSGTLSVFAGGASFGTPTAGAATQSMLHFPSAVATDASRDVYIADTANDVVEKVTPSGKLSIIAGVSGQSGAPTAGAATKSDLASPSAVAVDASGNVYIADTGNKEVEKVTPSGKLSIIAGTGSYGPPTPGPARQSNLGGPSGVAVDASGNVYIADTYNDEIEKVTPSGTLSIIAGTGTAGAPTAGPATTSELDFPTGIAVDASGNLYIADSGNCRIEKVTPSGTLSIIAGTGAGGPPTPGAATQSALDYPSGVAVDASGDLYIADTSNGLVERVTPSGALSIVAGNGGVGAPTAGPALSSRLNSPAGVAVDASGNLYIADRGNSDVEEVFADGASAASGS